MNEVTEQTNLPAAAPTVGNFLGVIAKAASDPNVDVAKMHGLIDVQERMMAKQAEIDFNIAFTAMQLEIPRINASSRIVHKGVTISNYAKYEDIDTIIRPIMLSHGFSLSFDSKLSGNNIIVFGTLAHKGGHSRTAEIPLTLEAGGAKNNVQAVGSTLSYGQRYLVKMLLNLVFEGQDDDGAAADFVPVTAEQAKTIREKITSSGATESAFLNYIGAKTVEEIDARKYDQAIIALNKKAAAQ